MTNGRRLVVLCGVSLAACSQYEIKHVDKDGAGDGDELFPKIEVSPTEIVFEDIDIVAGDPPLTQVVSVKNVGEDDLQVLDLYLAAGEASYTVSALSSYLLGVGATAQFTVTFEPEQPFEHPETVLIDSNDPEKPTAEVSLNGVGIAPQIEVDPISVDFGYLPVGCETVQTIAIRNIGNADLVLEEMPQFVPTDAQELHVFMGADYTKPEETWTFPLTIPVGEWRDIQVIYTPLDEVDDQATLTVESNDPFTPKVHADQSGGITGAEEALDLFEQPAQPMTDIVFIVDNSGSMYEEQTNLSNNFETFIWELDQTDADYQIGVITTDNGDFRGEVITADTLNPIDKFTDMAVAGTGGSGTERALQMLYQCVEPGGDCSEAAGFMRDDALFAGIIVSDEPDQSNMGPDDYVEYLWNLKDDPDLVKIHAIAGDVPVPECSSASAPGFGYDEAVELTEGTFLSVCASDWGESLSVLAAGSVTDLSQFKLSQDPVEDTIEVYVDDQQQPSGWWYTGHELDGGTNAVRFQDEYVPEGGSEVRIEYVVQGECGG